MISWVVFNVLARSPRPGYPRRKVRRAEVDAWSREALGLGICTVICLLADAELGELYFPALASVGGLLGAYRLAGLHVCHVPVPDLRDPPLDAKDLARVVEAFERSEKPVLIHCSAGADRTGSAVAAIQRLLVPEER